MYAFLYILVHAHVHFKDIFCTELFKHWPLILDTVIMDNGQTCTCICVHLHVFTLFNY